MSAPGLTPLAQPGCPVCNRRLEPTQSWCLECGAAARTRIAPTPRWRPFALIAAIAAILAIIAIGFAIARLAAGSSSPASTTARSTAQLGRPSTPTTPAAATRPIA